MISIFTQPFASLAKFESKNLGMPGLPMIIVPWPFDASSADKVVQEIDDMLESTSKTLSVSA